MTINIPEIEDILQRLRKVEQILATQKEKPKFLTLSQCADYLGFSYNTIYRKVREGEIKAVKSFRNYRISSSDLDDYIKQVS